PQRVYRTAAASPDRETLSWRDFADLENENGRSLLGFGIASQCKRAIITYARKRSKPQEFTSLAARAWPPRPGHRRPPPQPLAGWVAEWPASAAAPEYRTPLPPFQ